MRRRETYAWSDQEDRDLADEWLSSKSLGGLADIHERSMFAVAERLKRIAKEY